MKKQHLYGTASAAVALLTLASGAGAAFAQTATTTYNHGNRGYGNGYNYNNNGNHNTTNNNYSNRNYNNNGNYNNGHNGTYGSGNRSHGNYFYHNRNNLYFYYGGRQYYGAEYVYTGQAFNVTPNSFTMYINGVPYRVYYATGYQALSSAGGVIGISGVLPGNYVRVDGVFLNGIIYARSVRIIA